MELVQNKDLSDEANSEANETTRSTQSADTSDTTRDQQAATLDANEVQQPIYRLFTLTPELRSMIFNFTCTEARYMFLSPEEPCIDLPGPLPTGMSSLMHVLKDHHWRSEVIDTVWQNCLIVWHGSLTSTTWKRFNKMAMPRIRHLTIRFELTDQTWFDLESAIRQTLAWMYQKIKRGNRVGHSWSMRQLQLCGTTYWDPSKLSDGESKWYFKTRNPKPGCMHWSQDFSLERIRKCGITVPVYCYHMLFRLPPGWW